MKNNKIEYLIALRKQFCDTKGININDLSKYFNEFIEWITVNELIMKEYIDYLDFISFPIDGGLEIDKGRYDSMSLYRDIDISSIYGETLYKDISEFIICDNKPYVKNNDRRIRVYNNKIIMHNPYNLQDILRLKQLHNNGINISVGMYGLLDDENIHDKINALDNLRKQLISEYSIESDTDNNKYFISLNSINKLKTREKTRILLR